MGNPARVLMTDLPHSPQELVEITSDLIRQSRLLTDAYVRAMVYKASETIGVRLHDLADGMYIAVQPFGDYIRHQPRHQRMHFVLESHR